MSLLISRFDKSRDLGVNEELSALDQLVKLNYLCIVISIRMSTLTILYMYRLIMWCRWKTVAPFVEDCFSYRSMDSLEFFDSFHIFIVVICIYECFCFTSRLS